MNCGFDIRNEWMNGYYIWAGHNCAVYDLLVKLYIPKNAWMERKLFMSNDMDCTDE